LIAVLAIVAAICLMLLWFVDSLVYRRRFQYRIRSLLVLTVTIAIACDWLASEIRAARKQREVLTVIDNARVGYPSFPVGTYSFPADKLDWPAYWPRRVLGDDFFVTVDYVGFFAPGVTDAMLDNLKELQGLQKLKLDQTEISDAEMGHLQGLTRLQDLSIGESSVTDAGLANLAGLTKLRRLYVECTQVSDGGLEHLKAMGSLRELSLSKTKVSDNGLEYLKGLRSLRELWLFHTRVTDAGVKNLQQFLPNCKIHYSTDSNK
jgi:Leucine-rich repeat (LRR) protein